MLFAIIVNGFSLLTEELYKISLLKVFWNIAFFSISRAICIVLITLIVFRYHREINYRKNFSGFVFSFHHIYLADHIADNVYQVIILFLKALILLNLTAFTQLINHNHPYTGWFALPL